MNMGLTQSVDCEKNIQINSFSQNYSGSQVSYDKGL